MANSQQTTFTDVSINKYHGNRTCDKCMSLDGEGKPQTCTETAKIAMLRHQTGIAEFYCKIHSKETWLEMAGYEVE